MSRFVYTGEDYEKFELAKPGTYCFEVTGASKSISEGRATRGCDVWEVKLKLFNDPSFTKPVAMFTEKLTFPQTNDKDTNRLLTGKLNMFVKATGLKPDEETGEIEFSEISLVGLRGYCEVGVRTYEKKGQQGQYGEANQVELWAYKKGQIPPTEEWTQANSGRPF